MIINGNGKTIYGLTDMLVSGASQGVSSVEIYDLTIADSTIENDVNDSLGTKGVGAFIGHPDGGVEKVIISNCHLVNSTVRGGHWTGGIMGYAAGWDVQDNGPCFLDITIENCSVKDSLIEGKGSCGAIIGHATGNNWTKVTISDCDVEKNTVKSTGSSTEKAGSLMGTVGCAGMETYGKTGGVFVMNTNAVDNTVTSGAATIDRIYGRQGNENGRLFVDNVEYVMSNKVLEVAVRENKAELTLSLEKDLSLNVSDAYIKLGGADTTTLTLEGNNNLLTLYTTYWSRVNLVNPAAKLVINNAKVTSSQESGTWNSYDITFNCNVDCTNVEFQKAVALDGIGKTVNFKNVSIAETHDYYALWIVAVGQNVTLDGFTVQSSGRGVKIDNEYVDDADNAKVTLTVKNATFATESKAAILVKSPAGAEVNLENVDISNVKADTTNTVWVDEDAAAYASGVVVNGGTVIVEP